MTGLDGQLPRWRVKVLPDVYPVFSGRVSQSTEKCIPVPPLPVRPDPPLTLPSITMQEGKVAFSERPTIRIGKGRVAEFPCGRFRTTVGNLSQATDHFEDALAFCRKAGFRPELAWTCCDYSNALRERDVNGDRAKAITLLDESLAISSELGMRPLMERVLSRREILKA